MSAAIKVTESIQDSVLNAVQTSQRWTTDAVKAITATLDGFAGPLTAIPFAASLPTPAREHRGELRLRRTPAVRKSQLRHRPDGRRHGPGDPAASLPAPAKAARR